MKTEVTSITCDRDGLSPATGIRFGFKGRAYAIDLCDDCRSLFDSFWRNADLVKQPIRDRRKAE